MSTYPWPPVTPSSSSITLQSNTSTFISPLTGATQTSDRTGERIIMSLTVNNVKDSDRRALMSFASKMNGKANRVSLRDHTYTAPTGTLSTVAEMLDVTFNATLWASDQPTKFVLTDKGNGVLYTVQYVDTSAFIRPASTADGISAPTAGVSYAATVFTGVADLNSEGGAGPPLSLGILQSNGGAAHASSATSTTAQRLSVAATCPSASAFFIRGSGNVGDVGTTGSSASLSSLSVARCLLVDNGFNALTKSGEFDHADWTKSNCSISADAAVAPDGLTTADEFIEASDTNQIHNVNQTYTRASVAEFWTGSVFLKENTNERIRIRIDDGNSSNNATAFFSANTGTITEAAAVAGTATHSYASIHDIGNGWYRCRLSVKLAASTSAQIIIEMADGAVNDVTYNGDGSSSVYIWGAQLQRGGQLGRYTPTTTVAITGTDQTGKSIWLKGLDASTTGQLLAGDQIEINGQLLILDEDLDGDASGVGLAKVLPRIRTAPSDEDPVILYQPHGTFIMQEDAKWSNNPGGFTSMSISFLEDIT